MAIKALQNKSKAIAKLWERLEVEPATLDRHPSITPILKNSLGSVEAAIAALRGSISKEALELVRLWDLGSKNEHKVIPFEAYCLSAKSTPRAMLGIIIQAIAEDSKAATELLLATAHPEIVKRTIKIAKSYKGGDERKIILQNRGTMAAPKNQVFNNFGSVTQDNRQQVANVSLGQLDSDDDRISLGIEKFNASHMAEANRDKVIPVEVVSVVDEE